MLWAIAPAAAADAGPNLDLRGASALAVGSGGLGFAMSGEAAYIPRERFEFGVRWEYGFQTMLFSVGAYALAAGFVGYTIPENQYLQPYFALGGGAGISSSGGIVGVPGGGAGYGSDSPWAPAGVAGIGIRGTHRRFEWYFGARASALWEAGVALSMDNGLGVRLGPMPVQPYRQQALTP